MIEFWWTFQLKCDLGFGKVKFLTMKVTQRYLKLLLSFWFPFSVSQWLLFLNYLLYQCPIIVKLMVTRNDVQPSSHLSGTDSWLSIIILPASLTRALTWLSYISDAHPPSSAGHSVATAVNVHCLLIHCYHPLLLLLRILLQYKT